MAREAELQHLFHQLSEVLDPEGASTMIDLVSPFARNELATRADMLALRADIAELKHDLTRTFAGWLFVSQGVLVAVVGLVVSLR